MKKNEPLKNKRFVYDEEEDDFVRDRSEDGKVYTTLRNDAFIETDIKSAVEWLKDRSNDFATILTDEEYKRFVKIIHGAFPDLYPIGSDNSG